MAAMGAAPSDVEDYNFRLLYDEVLNFYLVRYNIPDEKISEALDPIKISFHYDKENQYGDVDYYRCTENICAYLFRYAPHGARLARYRILEAMDNCKDPQLQRILRIPQLKVASLGGGPGSDAIGFCSAMERCKIVGIVDIVVVDAVAEWLPCINKIKDIMKPLGERNPFGSDLFYQGRAELFFRVCTLGEQRPIEQLVQQPGQLPARQPDPFNLINECDVVLICKLISIMKSESITNLIQDLYSMMKDDALIFLIDSPSYFDDWNAFFDVLYCSNSTYDSTRVVTFKRFGYDDSVSTNAQIAILKKKRVLELDQMMQIYDYMEIYDYMG